MAGLFGDMTEFVAGDSVYASAPDGYWTSGRMAGRVGLGYAAWSRSSQELAAGTGSWAGAGPGEYWPLARALSPPSAMTALAVTRW